MDITINRIKRIIKHNKLIVIGLVAIGVLFVILANTEVDTATIWEARSLYALGLLFSVIAPTFVVSTELERARVYREFYGAKYAEGQENE